MSSGHTSSSPTRDSGTAKLSLENAAEEEGDILPCCAWQVFGCLKQEVRSEVAELMQAYGADELSDAQFIDQEFSLFQGMHNAAEAKVEIEDTNISDPEKCSSSQRRALERLEELYRIITLSGVSLWVLTIGGGLLGGLFSDCTQGTPWYLSLPLVAAVFIQVWQLDCATLLMSRSTFEGRPLVRLLCSLTGLDSYRVMSIFSVLDMTGRFSRAQFAGYALYCDGGIDDAFTLSVKSSAFSFMTPEAKCLGLGGIAILGLLGGAVAVQGGYALCCRHTVRQRLDYAASNIVGQMPGETMHMSTCIDEFGALAKWAMLDPVSRVFDLASVPTELDDMEDVKRLWGRLRTQTLTIAATIIPEGVFMVSLQVRFLAFAYDALDWSGKAQIFGSMFLTSMTAVAAAADMLRLNRVATFTVGVSIIVLLSSSFFRVAALFYCESHVLNISDFACMSASELRAVLGANGTSVLPT